MLPYTRGTGIPRLLEVRNYLNNYFAMYTRLTRSRIRVDPGLFGVRNYLNNYFAMYTRPTRARISAVLAPPPTWG